MRLKTGVVVSTATLLSCLPGTQATRAADAPPDRLLATGQAFGYVGNLGQRGDGNGDDGDLIRGRLFDYAPRRARPHRRRRTTTWSWTATPGSCGCGRSAVWMALAAWVAVFA